MKVTSIGVGRPATARPSSRSGGRKGSSGFAVDAPHQTVPHAVHGGASPVAPIPALLALQETPDATTGRARAAVRGKQLLDHLDEIRLGLLMGAIPRHTLKALASGVRAQRAEVADPRLIEILDEIELRAQVELTKYGGEA